MKKFLKAAAIRALHTVAQAALAAIGTSTFLGEVNWKAVASMAVLSGIISLLKSIIVGLPEAPLLPKDTDDLE